MRVFDCNRCSETVCGANDAELAAQLRRHYAAEHDEELSAEQADDLIASGAYAATDA